MGVRTLAVNGVQLCAETFGDAGDPAILLVGGAAAAMDWWDTALCERLAAGGRRVIRYDARDTGASTAAPPGSAAYTGDDLVDDAVGLLDVLGVDAAHVVGMSAGGMLAQRMAVRHPARVATLTLVATTPDGPGPEPLEPPRPLGGEPPVEPDWTDRAAVAAYLVALHLPYSGRAGGGAERLRAIAERVAGRMPDPATYGNQFHAGTGTDVRARLGSITAPTLVVHGTADPRFPFSHGEALAREIPGARLLRLDGVGHETPPPSSWDVFVPAVLKLTSGGWPEQADRLARKAYAAGDPTGWFDVLYTEAAADEVATPWDRTDPQPLLAEWARLRRPDGAGRSAVVVGCGLGADAEFVAGLGFATTAFDISPEAVRQAAARHPGSPVRYVTADLLDPPASWLRAYDLVLEVHTVQALPDPPRAAAIANVGRLVAPGGTLLAIAYRDPEGTADRPPPWPLTRAEVAAYATDGLTETAVHTTPDRWRAEFTRLP